MQENEILEEAKGQDGNHHIPQSRKSRFCGSPSKSSAAGQASEAANKEICAQAVEVLAEELNSISDATQELDKIRGRWIRETVSGTGLQATTDFRR